MSQKKRRRNSQGERTDSTGAVGAGSGSETAAGGLRQWWQALCREPIAIGLGLVILYRPWKDGMTFPEFNLWFTTAILMLTAFWGVRLLLRGERLRCAVPSGILVVFVVIAGLTGLRSIDADATIRSLLAWTSYLCLFLLCVNALRTRLSIGIVLGAFVVTSLFSALWAIVHIQYVLPELRVTLEMRPDMLTQYFGTPDLTPELHNRLMSNRAFGTFLFSNALAAFLIMGIPYFLGELRPSFAAWRKALRTRLDDTSAPQISSDRLNESAALGVAAWAFTGLLAWYVYPLTYSLTHPADMTGGSLGALLFWIGLVPLLVGMGSLVVTRWNGPSFLFLSLKTLTLPTALLVGFVALLLTYSRGGMLALFLGTALTVGLLVYSGSGKAKRGRLARAGVACVLLVAMLAAFMVPTSSAQNTANPAVGPGDPAQGAAPAQQGRRKLTLDPEGIKIELSELANPQTFRMRLRYWGVTWRIIKKNFWTGTGLGNFGVAYLNHQYLGEPDVKMSHNDYIQMFSETGVFGFLAFCAFWLYFAVWGALRIIRDQASSDRWVLCGLYAGIMAFLIHSLVDFNFANPSMTTIAFCLTGIFYARAHLMEPSTEKELSKRSYAQVLALPLLCVVAFAGFWTFRIVQLEWRLVDGTRGQKISGIGSRTAMKSRLAATQFFLQALATKQKNGKAVPFPLATASLLIPDRATIESFGVVRVVQAPYQSNRPLNPGEVPPPNTYVIIQDKNVPLAMREGALAVDAWLSRLREIDSAYAHNAEIANYLSSNYAILHRVVLDKQTKAHYSKLALDWAREAARRSPKSAEYRRALGDALFTHGRALWVAVQPNPVPAESITLYYEALPEFRKATGLYPSSELFWDRLSSVNDKLLELNANMRLTPQGRAVMDSLGLTGDGSNMRKEGVKAAERAMSIRKTRREWEKGI